MKALVILMAGSLFVAETIPSNRPGNGVRDISDCLEVRAIRALFDGIEPGELENENFGVIISDNSNGHLIPVNCRPTIIIAWFRFAYGRETIRLDYLSFPSQEEYGGPFNYDQPKKLLTEVLTKIIKDKCTAGITNIKHLNMFTPIALKNDAILKDVFQEEKGHRVTLHANSYYWGFKTSKNEIIANQNCYSNEFFGQIEQEILAYIIDTISHYDTPNEWKTKYIKAWLAWAYPCEYENLDDRICNYDPKFKLLKQMSEQTPKQAD